MKRNLIGILTLVVMTVLISSTGAYAQAYAKADVPFAFRLGTAQLPAGTYEVRVATTSAEAIVIQNHETSAGALSIARRESPRSTNAKLVFHRVGNEYFLAEIWRGSGYDGMIVPTSKQEKELEKELQAANGHSGGYEEVVVALN
jgi:hypothetical protein